MAKEKKRIMGAAAMRSMKKKGKEGEVCIYRGGRGGMDGWMKVEWLRVEGGDGGRKVIRL